MEMQLILISILTAIIFINGAFVISSFFTLQRA